MGRTSAVPQVPGHRVDGVAAAVLVPTTRAAGVFPLRLARQTVLLACLCIQSPNEPLRVVPAHYHEVTGNRFNGSIPLVALVARPDDTESKIIVAVSRPEPVAVA